MRVGVVDIGTNSTRLLVADVRARRVQEIQRESEVTRLGERVEASGALGEAGQERVLAVLERYAAALRAHGVERSAAVMTSAVRDAANGAAFAARVHERSGLAGHVLSGAEEAAFTFAGATLARPADATDGLVVVDIGGGSTELICGTGRELGFHVSTQIGVVRHSERHLGEDPPPPAALEALAHDVAVGLAEAVPADVRARVGAAVAVAGTATSCAAIELELEPYDSARVEGRRLSRSTLAGLRERLAALPLAQRRRVRGLHPDRAPVIVAGVVILLQVLDAFGLEEVEVSERDLLWGVALDLAC